MMCMEIKDEAAGLLFLRYALPSAVGREGEPGSCSGDIISASKADPKLVEQVSRGELPGIDIRSNFRVAACWCDIIAKELGRESIDDDVIRAYFWFIHDAVIDRRVNAGEKFDSAACRVLFGSISDVDSALGSSRVETPFGKIECNTVLVDDPKVGDRVATHFNYITEKVSPELERKMYFISGDLAGLLRKLDAPETGKKMKIGA